MKLSYGDSVRGVSIGVALCGSIAGAALADPSIDFTAAAKPLWLTCAGLGVVIFSLGIFATSRRAIASADRLAPLIAGHPVGGRVHVAQPAG